MKKVILFYLGILIGVAASAQFTYKIKADTLLVTNDSCTAELALENSTKHIKGFLYNYGKGRTHFVPALTKVNDTTYVIGVDTMKLRATSVDAWRLNGNTGTNFSTNFIGTTNNVGLAFRTNNTNRMVISETGNVGIGTASPGTSLHIVTPTPGDGIYITGTNPGINLAGDVNSYYTAIVLSSQVGAGKLDNYGINGLAGMMLSVGTANGAAGTGASSLGPASVTSDSTIIAHRVIGARGQTADLFRISQNTHYLAGAFFENPVFSVNKDGNIWTSGYADYYGGASLVPNIRVGYDGTNPQAILINGVDIATPAIKITNLTYGGSHGVIDISSNSAYNYDWGGSGSGSGLRFIKVAANGGGLHNYGATYIDHQVNNNSNQEYLYSNYAKTRVGANNGYSYYADAGTLSGGAGIGYAFYAQAGQSMFKDKVTMDGPNGYSQLRLAQTYTPSATGDGNGQTGDVAWDGSYIYIKTASGWKRASLSTF